MITVRPAAARGAADFGWLNSRHTFSFGEYHDPAHMGFGHLRVINDDRVAGGGGFPPHPHRDMEIISYVVEGGLEHADTLGNRSVIRPGDVQRMSAGTGVRHSEFNASATEPVRFLQIWILPERQGLPAGYEQKAFPEAEKRGRLRLVGSRDGRDGSVVIHQDVDLHAGLLDWDERADLTLAPGRRAWVQVVRGALSLNGTRLSAGDGAAVTDERALVLDQARDAEVLVFDLA